MIKTLFTFHKTLSTSLANFTFSTLSSAYKTNNCTDYPTELIKLRTA